MSKMEILRIAVRLLEVLGYVLALLGGVAVVRELRDTYSTWKRKKERDYEASLFK
jgi:multisubunit Na+/H+ antiporter MnhG subunit